MSTPEAQQVHAQARAARRASRPLAALGTEQRSALLRSIAAALEDEQQLAPVREANAADLEAGRAAEARGELASALVARLGLGPAKLAALADGLRQLADAPTLLGRISQRRALDEELVLERVSCPLGVLGIVFEARPDAVVQITGLALTSGNAVLLKGGSEALRSNRALIELIHRCLRAHDVDPACVCLLEDRAAFRALLDCHAEVDLIIARGSGSFVQLVMDSTKIPVLGHAEGLCHVYLHADAPAQHAAKIVVDAKCDYPAACNAVETLLWHADAREAAAASLRGLAEQGVELRGDEATLALGVELGLKLDAATSYDWDAEYGELVLSVAQVESLDAALEHIEAHGSRHTEAIVCEDPAAGERFVRGVDAACTFVNASTRFADGYRFGLGAEVGIATGKLHARGPVGVEGLLSYRWILRGQGQVAADYGPGKRSYLHTELETS